MSEDIVLKAKKREEVGRKVKALRRAGSTPAVVHDHGKDSIHVAVLEPELKKAYSAAGKHHPIKLDIDGKKYTTIIKEVTRKPATNIIYHTVFQAVSADEKVSTQVPVQIVGEIPAEKASLLVLKSLDSVEVEALSKDLVDVVEVSGEKLADVGDKIHISDLQVPPNVTIKTDPETVIATVEMPKDQIAEADAALEEQKAADGITEEAETPDEAEGEQSADAADKPDEVAEPTDKKD